MKQAARSLQTASSIKFTFVFLFLFLAASTLTAQFKNMNRYDPPHGINMGFITGIAQDAKGYMWFADSGTGLGLSLAYDIIIKGHGGTLTVESTEGEGTIFIFQLPIK